MLTVLQVRMQDERRSDWPCQDGKECGRNSQEVDLKHRHMRPLDYEHLDVGQQAAGALELGLGLAVGGVVAALQRLRLPLLPAGPLLRLAARKRNVYTLDAFQRSHMRTKSDKHWLVRAQLTP
jgi:hypothetical protein